MGVIWKVGRKRRWGSEDVKGGRYGEGGKAKEVGKMREMKERSPFHLFIKQNIVTDSIVEELDGAIAVAKLNSIKPEGEECS